MRTAGIVAMLACGRYDFRAQPPDAPDPCTISDGICEYECAAVDPDCITTCGDGICVGNAGELCVNCAADCKTMAAVCGNGACDPGEDVSCYADCGPVPWPWTDLEAQIVTAINNARTGGWKCPGAGMLTTPALIEDVTLQRPIRDWAWEIAHENLPGGGCNGRTGQDRVDAVGASAAWVFWGATSVPADAVNYWLNNAGICPTLITASATHIGVAATNDAIGACYGIMLR